MNRFPLLDPKGIIGLDERNLMIVAAVLMLLVVIPVYIMAFVIARRYRAGNTGREYRPDWGSSWRYELAWWAFPCAVILVLSIITWQSSHALDPSQPIASPAAPLTIQVVALDWKWLFIYPQQHIASVNLAVIPVGTPIDFEITADAPMNSFWIPRLGGQIYAMPGMATHLHLMADVPGDYRGLSANFSGAGFSDMTFTARAESAGEFTAWAAGIAAATTTDPALTAPSFEALAKPSTAVAPVFYSSADPALYNEIVKQYVR